MRRCCIGLITLACLAALDARADILYLRDGSRHTGTLLRSTESQVTFRIVLADGASEVTRVFPTRDVVRIERGPLPPPTAATPEAAETADRPEDFEQMIREAYELLADDDLSAALAALQRVATRADDAELARRDAQVRHDRGVSLARLLAETRLRVAEAEPGGLRLNYATPYESEELARLLRERTATLLATDSRGAPLSRWLDHPEQYTWLDVETRQLVQKAQACSALLATRMRIDPTIDKNRTARRDLIQLRDRLSRFIATLQARPGYTAIPADPNTAPSAADAALDAATNELARRAHEPPTSQPVQPPTQIADPTTPMENPRD